MKPSQALLIIVSLTSSAWAQSNTPSPPQEAASSQARQPESSAANAPVSSVARPPASASSPNVDAPPLASSARSNPTETTAAVSQPVPKTPENSPKATSVAVQVAASSKGNDRTVDSPSPSALNVNPGNSNNPQATQAPSISVQGGSTSTGAASAAPTTSRTGAAQPGSPSNGNGTDTRSGSGSGAGAGAGVATASPSSPNLATTVSFSAQPSDGFSNVNQSVVEKMPESKTPTPPDVSTLDQFNAKLTANVPEKAISQKNAKALAILETAYFEYFVNKDPAPVDMGKIAIPASISQCQTQYARSLVQRSSFVDEVFSYVPLLSRDLRGFENCKAVESLEVGVYFHYMRATSTADKPNELESRVKAQVDVLNEALGAIKINFRYMSLNWWEPKTGEDWSVVTRRESKLQEWQQRTRGPGKLTLTVWLVNGLRGSQNDDLNSYATFPNENLDANDGIVIEAAHVQGGDSTTLVHDVGHWLGLGHTFGDTGTQCGSQDGLTNATQTSGMKDVVYECSQVPCSGGNAVEINNYMSDGFTTDQKARMFANALQFRRGYEAGECMPDGKAAVRKRSSMQDLLDGKCPDVDKQANILMDTPHSLSARTHGLSKMGWAVLAGWWAATLVM
ncbi:metalloprotease [Colletotrichum kahawae]|uniref:Metalloprotease n=1 Tax=Colletotrichum kahawae TaxID=34407 RepID=A0AAD9YA18_COLKA|nr:metalloprotease [Colletotrichum kahawae]